MNVVVGSSRLCRVVIWSLVVGILIGAYLGAHVAGAMTGRTGDEPAPPVSSLGRGSHSVVVQLGDGYRAGPPAAAS